MKLIIAALCAVLPFGAVAQSTPGGRLGTEIGRMLFPPPPSADDYLRAAQIQANMEAARAASAEADRVEYENTIRSALADAWVKSGLSQEEASAVASAYQYQQIERAIVERAKRDGSQATATAMAAAYKAYNYLLADQLMIAYFQAADAERKAANATE